MEKNAQPPGGVGRHVWLAGLLGNAHDAAVAVVRCRSGCTQDEFFASRQLAPAGLQALLTLQRSLLDLPEDLHRELGGVVDWHALEDLADCLPPVTEKQRDEVWEAMGDSVPTVLMALRRLKLRAPDLFNPLGWGGSAAPEPELRLRFAELRDLDRCHEIERTAYEGDEAATREKIATRIAEYPQGFVVLERDGEVVGFINSGCAHEVAMADEAFKELIGHDPAAPNVVIMSVVVAPEHQGQGYSTRLMRHFVEQMRQAGKRTIHLMCREKHIELYRKLGYDYVRPSPSEHGGMAWFEMVMRFGVIRLKPQKQG